MKWELGFSREAEKFLNLEKIRSQAIEEIKNVIKRMKTPGSTGNSRQIEKT